MSSDKIKHQKSNVAPAAIKKQSRRKKGKKQAKGFFGSISKELYPLFLACMTTAVSVFIAKAFVPYVQESMGQEDSVMLGQPYWEEGTTAFIEFRNPTISEESDHFNFVIEQAYVASFEIASFENHKFSLNDDRTKHLYSYNDELRLFALLNVKKSKSAQVSSPLVTQVSGVYKDDSGMGFRLHWSSLEEKKQLEEAIEVIRNNPRAKIKLMYDFIDTYTMMNKHLGLISNRGVISQDKDGMVIEVKLRKNQNIFNDKSLILYGLGDQEIEYIFNDNQNFKRERKILNQNDLSNTSKPKAILDEVNFYQPEMIIFGPKPPLIGKASHIDIKDGVLKIRFKSKYDISKNIDNIKITSTILFDLEALEHQSSEYLDTGQVVEGDGGYDFDVEIIGELKQSEKIFAKITWHGYDVLGMGNYAFFETSHDEIESFVVEDLFTKSIVSPQDDSLKVNLKLYFNGISIMNYHGKLQLQCCSVIANIKRDPSRLTLHQSQLGKKYMQKGAKFSYPNLAKETLLLWTWLDTPLAGLYGEKAVLYKKNGAFFLDVILSVNERGIYDDALTVGFYAVENAQEYYAFSNNRQGWSKLNVKQFKKDRDIVSKKTKLGKIFNSINKFSTNAVILINNKRFFVRVDKVEAKDEYIRFKLKLLEGTFDDVKKGEFTILFEE